MRIKSMEFRKTDDRVRDNYVADTPIGRFRCDDETFGKYSAYAPATADCHGVILLGHGEPLSKAMALCTDEYERRILACVED